MRASLALFLVLTSACAPHMIPSALPSGVIAVKGATVYYLSGSLVKIDITAG